MQLLVGTQRQQRWLLTRQRIAQPDVIDFRQRVCQPRMEQILVPPQEIRNHHRVIFSRGDHQRDAVPGTDGVARGDSRAQDATEHDVVKLRGLPRGVEAGTLKSMIWTVCDEQAQAASHSTI